MEGHDITVNSHQTQQPGGANEQQEQKGHPQSSTGAHVENHNKYHISQNNPQKMLSRDRVTLSYMTPDFS